MKRTIIITIAVLLAAGVFLASSAEGKGWFEKGRKAKGKPMMELCPMHMMMYQKAVEKKMVALEDGSIVIMACGKLYKYDKDLNLVKDVELTKINEDMKAKMEEIRKECAEKCKMKAGKAESGAEQIKEDIEP